MNLNEKQITALTPKTDIVSILTQTQKENLFQELAKEDAKANLKDELAFNQPTLEDFDSYPFMNEYNALSSADKKKFISNAAEIMIENFDIDATWNEMLASALIEEGGFVFHHDYDYYYKHLS